MLTLYSRKEMFHLILNLIFLAGLVASECPDSDTTLLQWSDITTWDTSSLPGSGSIVSIDRSILLDVTYITVKEINVIGSGRLVFSDQVGDITIDAEGILVQDSGSLIIGAEDCRFQNNVNIRLNGSRTTNRTLVGGKGEKYIVVQDQGVLQIYGKDKLSWTKLSQTAERWAVDDNNVVYNHATSSYLNTGLTNNGPAMYIFDGENLQPTFYKVFNIDASGGTSREQKRVDLMIETLNAVEAGEIVAIAIQRRFKTTANVDELFATLESVANITRVAIRDADETDAYALVFQKGGDFNEAYDPAVGKNGQVARAHIVLNGKKVAAVSNMKDARSNCFIEFRIIDQSIGFPIINVVHDVSSWKVGDEVIVTSTDYSRHHTERRTILEVISANTIKLSDELDYRHFGEVEDGVDMRAEVALLTRNIKIQGVMERGCPENNENCNEYSYDTYGAHTKIFGFSSIHIEGVEFSNVGQTTDNGFYPIHFHMCLDVSDKNAVLKSNTIRNSYARAVTIHGTWGQTETQHGVKILNNVAYDIMGHAYFLEDGAEKATILDGNLGATIKSVIGNGFATDRSGPVVFWITNPKVILTNNVAVGAEGFGYWYVFPTQPVGPSFGLGAYKKGEARLTPLWTFDNNIAHSNKGGLRFDNILVNDRGSVTGCMNYKSVSNPFDKESDPVKVQLLRFTAYKNININVWLRGGMFEMIQLSSAESRRGVQLARGSSLQQFVTKSIIVGKSRGNSEDPSYPDAATDIPHFIGVVFYDGPVYVDKTWFNGFTSVEGQYLAGALGFATKNKHTSSVVSNTTDLRFGFVDKIDGSGGNRVFDGTEDDELFGFGNFDGDESATFRDGDGSVTGCPGLDWSRPVQVVKPEKYTITDSCMKRDNWQMVVCENNYGKLSVDVMKAFNGTNTGRLLSESQTRRLNRLDPMDVAYEDHSGEKKSEFMTIVGSGKYYYQLQFLNSFPKKVRFYGKGVERDYSVIVGVCLPEGLSPSDVNLVGLKPPGVTTPADGWIIVDTVEELFEDDTMTRAYLEGRILHVRLMNPIARDSDWDKWDTDHCPGRSCPHFTVEILKDEITGYSPCFTATDEELNTDVHLDNMPTLSCELPASLPEPDWGAGDTLRPAIEGDWGEWSSWSDCCGDEETFRYRLCDNPTPYGSASECSGSSFENGTCTMACPVDGQLTQWSRWTDCFCNGIAAGSSGAQTRTRECDVAHNGEFCSNSLTESRSCFGDCR